MRKYITLTNLICVIDEFVYSRKKEEFHLFLSGIIKSCYVSVEGNVTSNPNEVTCLAYDRSWFTEAMNSLITK